MPQPVQFLLAANPKEARCRAFATKGIICASVRTPRGRAGRGARENLFWIGGAFVLTLWVVAVFFLLRDPWPHLLFGALGIVAVVLAGTAGSTGRSRLMHLTPAGIVLGLVVALSWFLYQFAVLPSVLVAMVGITLIRLGLEGN